MNDAEPIYFVGWDPALLNDFSGLVLIHKRSDAMLDACQVFRFPRGVPYWQQVDQVADWYQRLSQQAAACITVDSSGLGEPVCSMLEKQGIHPRRVSIFGAGSSKQCKTVPKHRLVEALTLAIEERYLVISATGDAAEVLKEELLAFALKRRPTGFESFEAAGGGAHDDLAIALMIATMEASKDHVIHGAYEAVRLRQDLERKRLALRDRQR